MQLKVIIERVLYPPEKSTGDWYIIKTDQGIIKGKIHWRPKTSERLIIEGNYAAYQGQKEFKFTGAMPDVPESPRGLLIYAAELTRGMGQAITEEIWETLGENWQEIKSGDCKIPDKVLLELQKTIDTLKIEAEKTIAISYLMELGLTINASHTAWEKWQKETIGVVQNNCYALCEIPGYGFTFIDSKVRAAFKIPDCDPRRTRAGILYAIGQVCADGSTVAEWLEVENLVSKYLPSVPWDLVIEQTKEMMSNNEIVPFPESQMLALKQNYIYEKAIWEAITNEYCF